MSPKVKPPPVPAPAPIPEVGIETGEQAIKRQRAKSGFEKTLLTGSLATNTGKKTTLGA